jgi:hypothetical protein
MKPSTILLIISFILFTTIGCSQKNYTIDKKKAELFSPQEITNIDMSFYKLSLDPSGGLRNVGYNKSSSSPDWERFRYALDTKDNTLYIIYLTPYSHRFYFEFQGINKDLKHSYKINDYKVLSKGGIGSYYKNLKIFFKTHAPVKSFKLVNPLDVGYKIKADIDYNHKKRLDIRTAIIEATDYTKIISKYKNAITNYDVSYTPNQDINFDELISDDFIEKALTNANNISQVNALVTLTNNHTFAITPQKLKIKKNQLNFEEQYNHLSTLASFDELETYLLDKEKLQGVATEKLTSLKTRRDTLYQENIKQIELQRELDREAEIQTERDKRTCQGFLNAYKLTSSMDDLREAGKLASTKQEDIMVEQLLLKNISPDKVFTMQQVSKNSKIKNLDFSYPILENVSSALGTQKLINMKFKLSSKKPLRGDYKVKVDLVITYHMKITTSNTGNFFGKLINAAASMMPRKEVKTYSKTFDINARNNYTDTKEFQISIIGVSMSTLGLSARTKVIKMSYQPSIVAIIPN